MQVIGCVWNTVQLLRVKHSIQSAIIESILSGDIKPLTANIYAPESRTDVIPLIKRYRADKQKPSRYGFEFAAR